jgi:predicted RNase H-like HicB family nuclease
MRVLTAVLWQEDRGYVAKCLELGTASQGANIEDALSNLREATTLFLREGAPSIERKLPPLVAAFQVPVSSE